MTLSNPPEGRDDLVERLERYTISESAGKAVAPPICLEAAREIRRLREALKPFAELAWLIDDETENVTPYLITRAATQFERVNRHLTAADLRRARSALGTETPGDNG